jgi:hemolysin activation/secretion protein
MRPALLNPMRRLGGVFRWLAALGIFLGLPALWSRCVWWVAGVCLVCSTGPVFAQTNSAPNNAGADVRAALTQKMAELDAQERLTNLTAKVHVVPVSTNAGPRFRVDKFVVEGNTLLSPGEIGGIFTNVPAAFGTNVTLDAILAAAGDLQTAYRERGFMTVKVWLPPQKLTNAMVKVGVIEAPLAAIHVTGNRYYSEQNVMRALPDLRTNILLNAKIFQRELDAANMSRDRQIYPVIGPGPEPGTSELTLTVKDRLPWHARLEVNNDQATPGTPKLRANFSSQYDNLWNLEHQVGLQYSFSIEQLKEGTDFVKVPLDDPRVVNYSGYYRLPLGGYPSVQNQVDANPGSFGYNEATHQFNLPPPTGRPELTFFASRAVSDTGVQNGPIGNAAVPQPFTNNGAIYTPLTFTTNSAGENITLNEDLGLKLVMPLPQIGKITASFSLGADFKHFQQNSYNTNENDLTVIYFDAQQNKHVIPLNSPQPILPSPSTSILNYLPLNAGLNGSMPDKFGTTFFNANANFNVLPGFSKGVKFAQVSYAGTAARANYVTLQLGADRVQTLPKDWSVKLHADGQWANTALIGNEQYAIGGTTGVRGYTDGEAYGDTGWRVMIEPQLPPIDIGMFGNEGDEESCWLRGSVFMDYGETCLLEPASGSSGRQKFWGAGWAATVSLGSHVDGRVSMAWPLTDSPHTQAGDVHLYFGIGAQF